jgi:DNA-binding MarR family transcriptional regulator
MVNKQTKQRVLDYIIKHPGASDAEISEALKMHIVDVTAALLLLEEEGLIEEAK